MRGLRLGLGMGRGGGNAAAFSVSIGSGPFTTGTELTAVITPDPAPLVPTYQYTDDGGNITGATSASYTAAIGTDSVADASLIRAVATIDGVPYTSPAREIRYAAGSFGTLTNQSFTEGVESTYQHVAATGTGLTWTYAASGLPSGVSYEPSTRTFTFADTTAIQSGTVITVTATDQYSRAATGSPRTFTLEITEDISVDPTLSAVDFTAPGSGAPQRLDITASYLAAPADTLQLIFATRNGGTALTAAQLLAGTGTFLERVVVNPFSGTEVALSSLTATSEAATAVDVILAEVNNGGVSAVVTETVSGLDFTAPAFSSAVPADNATDAAIDVSPAITFAENVFAGTGSFILRNVTAGTDVETFNIATGTGSAGGTIGISGAVVTINPNADLANSTAYSIRWPAGALLDANGNPLAVNAGDSIYNFTTVAAASAFSHGLISTINGINRTIQLDLTGWPTGSKVYAIMGPETNNATGVTLDGNAGSAPIASYNGGTAGRRAWVLEWTLAADGAANTPLVLPSVAGINSNNQIGAVFASDGATAQFSWADTSDDAVNPDYSSSGLTPTDANNAAYAIGLLRSLITEEVWTAPLVEQSGAALNGARFSYAVAEDVALSSFVPAVTLTGLSERKAAALIMFSEAP